MTQKVYENASQITVHIFGTEQKNAAFEIRRIVDIVWRKIIRTKNVKKNILNLKCPTVIVLEYFRTVRVRYEKMDEINCKIFTIFTDLTSIKRTSTAIPLYIYCNKNV